VTDVVCAGHICLDLIPVLQSQVDWRPGSLIESGPVHLSTGGAVPNVGLALNTLGASACLMGAIGQDLFGQAIRQKIEAARAEHRLKVKLGESSSYSIVIAPPGSDRIFLHNPGANATFGQEDLEWDLIQIARVFHFGYPPLMARICEHNGRELAEILARANRLGPLVSLDMSLPDPNSTAGRLDWRSILANALPHVHLFIPSAEELLFMLDRPAYDRLAASGSIVHAITEDQIQTLAEQAIELGAGLVALKLGDRGLYIRADQPKPPIPQGWTGFEKLQPCFQVEVASTAGAGDATAAGLIFALLHQFGPEKALTAALAAGAASCEAPDAVSGIKPWPVIEARIAAGWPIRATPETA